MRTLSDNLRQFWAMKVSVLLLAQDVVLRNRVWWISFCKRDSSLLVEEVDDES